MQHEFRAGVYRFKVSLGKIWQRMALSSEQSLFDLSQLILQSVDFDSDHLHKFTYKNRIGRTVEIFHSYLEEDTLFTDEVCICNLPLDEGNSMSYVFDFGDWWELDVQLETAQTNQVRSNYAETLEACGDAPPQYRSWDKEQK